MINLAQDYHSGTRSDGWVRCQKGLRQVANGATLAGCQIVGLCLSSEYGRDGDSPGCSSVRCSWFAAKPLQLDYLCPDCPHAAVPILSPYYTSWITRSLPKSYKNIDRVCWARPRTLKFLRRLPSASTAIAIRGDPSRIELRGEELLCRKVRKSRGIHEEPARVLHPTPSSAP